MAEHTVHCDGVHCDSEAKAAEGEVPRGWIVMSQDGNSGIFCSWKCAGDHVGEQVKQGGRLFAD